MMPSILYWLHRLEIIAHQSYMPPKIRLGKVNLLSNPKPSNAMAIKRSKWLGHKTNAMDALFLVNFIRRQLLLLGWKILQTQRRDVSKMAVGNGGFFSVW
jgi:hypothetical protein